MNIYDKNNTVNSHHPKRTKMTIENDCTLHSVIGVTDYQLEC